MLAGVILYAFLKARRERRRPGTQRQPTRSRRDRQPATEEHSAMTLQRAVRGGPAPPGHRPPARAWSCPGSPRRTSASCCSTTCCGPSKAKEEHDAFAEALRDQGVQVHYFGQLLAETLELPEGRAFVLDRVCTPEIARARRWSTPLRQLVDDLDGASAGRVPGRRGAQGRPAAAAGAQPEVGHAAGRRLRAARRCPTTCSRGTTPAGSTAASRSTRWPSPPGSARPCTAGPSTATTRCSPSADFVTYYGDDDADHLPASVEGGDVHVLGHGAVLIGMGERTTPMAVEIAGPRAVRSRPGQHR